MRLNGERDGCREWPPARPSPASTGRARPSRGGTPPPAPPPLAVAASPTISKAAVSSSIRRRRPAWPRRRRRSPPLGGHPRRGGGSVHGFRIMVPISWGAPLWEPGCLLDVYQVATSPNFPTIARVSAAVGCGAASAGRPAGGPTSRSDGGDGAPPRPCLPRSPPPGWSRGRTGGTPAPGSCGTRPWPPRSGRRPRPSSLPGSTRWRPVAAGGVQAPSLLVPIEARAPRHGHFDPPPSSIVDAARVWGNGVPEVTCSLGDTGSEFDSGRDRDPAAPAMLPILAAVRTPLHPTRDVWMTGTCSPGSAPRPGTGTTMGGRR